MGSPVLSGTAVSPEVVWLNYSEPATPPSLAHLSLKRNSQYLNLCERQAPDSGSALCAAIRVCPSAPELGASAKREPDVPAATH